MSASDALTADERVRWRKALRAAGLKCTEQRLAVLRELSIADTPLTHREVLERLAHFHWDPATIFRNLNDLCEQGLLARMDVGDHVWRFEVQGRNAQSPVNHPHFLCVDCGAIACLHEVSVAETSRRWKLPATVRAIDEVLLKGRCGACKTRNRVNA
jgi:Fur family transcriptional regulator, ferric uptake regulator